MASTTQEQQQMLRFGPLPKKTRKEIFLEEMNRVVRRMALVARVQPHARGAHQALGGRPPFAVEAMLRIHYLQLWWMLSDPAIEAELHERRCTGRWHIAMRPGKTCRAGPEPAPGPGDRGVEQIKASIRAKVEHPFRVIKQQFGYAKVRYQGLTKNTARLQACLRWAMCG